MNRNLKTLLAVLAFSFAAHGMTGTLTPMSSTVECYDVFELSFAHSVVYANPWEDLSLAAEFVSPTQDTFRVGGFYYGADEWRIRFSPMSAGAWTYSVNIISALDSMTQTGAFTCATGSRHGFLRKHPDNPVRFAYTDGSAVNLVGLSDCVRDLLWGMDTRTGLSTQEYFGTFADAGFNMFRISVDNCAFAVADSAAITVNGNRYLLTEALTYDTLCTSLRSLGYSVGFCMFCSFGKQLQAWPDDTGNVAKMDAVKRYINYCVNRWGAYSDILELVNEPWLGPYTMAQWNGWYRIMAPFLRTIDPYGRLLSTTWKSNVNPVNFTEFDVCMPHKYYDYATAYADNYVSLDAASYKFLTGAAMPVLFGETGNSMGCNWDDSSGLRMRLRHWSAFFNECYFISWHTGYSQSMCGTPANIYLGPEERQYIRVLQNYTQAFDAAAVPSELGVSDVMSMRGYGLSADTVLGVYCVNWGNQAVSLTSQTVTVEPAFSAGNGVWLNPATGDTLAHFTTHAGSQDLAIPDFKVDIAAKIVSSAQPGVERNARGTAAMLAASPNPFNPSVTVSFNTSVPPKSLVIYDMRGRKVADLTHRVVKSAVIWDASDNASGLYIVEAIAGEARLTKRILLVK